MKHYQIYLDESGEFKEKKNGVPSIVAGYLADRELRDDWAQMEMEKIKHSHSDYKSIDIKKFHSKDDKNPHLTSFITNLICDMREQGIQIIEFKNQRNLNIIDSDVTYLNVFVQGIVQLMYHLLSLTRDKIHLDIIYAHRIYVTEKEQTGSNVRIELEQYEIRLKERLILALARLPQADRNRLSYTFKKTGNAVYDAPLMPADAICFALRGGKSHFTREEKARIFSEPLLSFSVLSDSSWNVIEDALTQNRISDAVYDWYARNNESNLKRYQNQFFSLLIKKLKEIGESGQEVQFNMLSQFIDALIKQRHFNIANAIMDCLLEEFYPYLQAEGFNVKGYLFDIAFYRLTTATHQGDTAKSDNLIECCEHLRQGQDFELDKLDYYLSYELRIVEHFKNIFDFEKAEEKLQGLKNILQEIMDIIPAVSGLSGIQGPIHSMTLGKILGSSVQTRMHLLAHDSGELEQARKDSNEAIQQFSRTSDKARQFQNRAALECQAGQYEEAIIYLAKSIGVTFDGDYKKLLKPLCQEEAIRIFELSLYAEIMARAFQHQLEMGKEMLLAWQILAVERKLKDGIINYLDTYPGYVINWNIGRCYAIQKDLRRANTCYTEAKNTALAQLDNFTIYSAGLAIMAEQITLPGNLTVKNMTKFQRDYQNFIQKELPDSMKSVLLQMKESIEQLTEQNDEQQLLTLHAFTASIPVL